MIRQIELFQDLYCTEEKKCRALKILDNALFITLTGQEFLKRVQFAFNRCLWQRQRFQHLNINSKTARHSLEGSCQEGRRFFLFFFARLYTLQTQQRLAPSISNFSAAAINALRQTLIWIKGKNGDSQKIRQKFGNLVVVGGIEVG